jgi:hypothetical protein
VQPESADQALERGCGARKIDGRFSGVVNLVGSVYGGEYARSIADCGGSFAAPHVDQLLGFLRRSGEMVAMGVLDPTKVTRTALQNAASVASLMRTTDCMVAELVEDKPAGGGGMGSMGMDM